jgi:hypothetical protein
MDNFLSLASEVFELRRYALAVANYGKLFVDCFISTIMLTCHLFLKSMSAVLKAWISTRHIDGPRAPLEIQVLR